MNQPLRYADPLGLWAEDAHNYFIDGVFGNLDPAIRDIIKSGSQYADTMRFQGPDFAFMHAMSSDTLSPDEARKNMCQFIRDKFSDAEDAKRNNSANYWFYMGMALHAVMDSTSPAHEGFQKWHGVYEDGSKHGPWPSSLENLAVAKQPYHTLRTIQRMREALQGRLGECGC